jgi:hypothetical protein
MDLWPLYLANEASQDSRELIDAFLKEDQEFATILSKDDRNQVRPVAIQLPPDLEARSFTRIRRAWQGRSVFRILALAFTGLAMVRLVSDWPFDRVAPTSAVGTLAVAMVFWVAFLFHRKYLHRRPGERPSISRQWIGR